MALMSRIITFSHGLTFALGRCRTIVGSRKNIDRKTSDSNWIGTVWWSIMRKQKRKRMYFT